MLVVNKRDEKGYYYMCEGGINKYHYTCNKGRAAAFKRATKEGVEIKRRENDNGLVLVFD